MSSTLYRLARVARKREIIWRYGFNLAPTLKFKLHHRALRAEAARVLEDLTRHGVAVSSEETLLGPASCFQELSVEVARLQRQLANKIATAKARASDTSETGEKSFLLEYLGSAQELDPESVYARFALQDDILQIANAYFGMLTRLRYYNVWHNFPSEVSPRQSQLWHRDREDLYILKVFVYLSDVTHASGPFTYARGTHRRGHVTQEPRHILEGQIKRSTDEQMAAVVPTDQWLTAIGRKGTIVFADTHGYHKGGLTREGDRLLYTCLFTSQASESKEFFTRSTSTSLVRGRAVSFALG